MKITVLVIVYRGNEAISMHENEEEAWSKLTDFISSHAALDLDISGQREACVDPDSVERFFSDPNDMYVIAEADTSQIVEYLNNISE